MVIGAYQFAGSGDKDGYITAECERNTEQLLVYNFSLREDDFGQMGRRYINAKLVK